MAYADYNKSPMAVNLLGNAAISAAQRSISPKQNTTVSSPPASQPPPPPQQTPDISTDPILQQITAFNNKAISDAEALSLQQRKQALINFGYDATLANLFPDEQSAQAAKANPYSVLANLAHRHQLRQTSLNEAYNKANLFYGGHRGLALGEEERQYGQEQYGANQDLAANLLGIDTNRINTENAALGNIATATGEAYGRTTANAGNVAYGAPAPTPTPLQINMAKKYPSTALTMYTK